MMNLTIEQYEFASDKKEAAAEIKKYYAISWEDEDGTWIKIINL